MLNPRSVLITGANRGIGLELTRQLLRLTDPPEHVFATCRHPESATVRTLLVRSPSFNDITRYLCIEI